MIRFDRRDTGVSDPIRDDLTLEAHVADALAVMDAVESERPVLLGSTEGARSAAALAAMHPERAAGLIVVAGTVRGAAASSPEFGEEVAASIADETWPEGIIGFFAPEMARDPERRDRLIRYMRTTATPRQAERLLRMSLSSDVSDVLPLVQAPTMVLHPRESIFPAAGSREFAELIPGAEFREIDGGSTLVYALENEAMDAIEEFVTGSAPSPRPTASSQACCSPTSSAPRRSPPRWVTSPGASSWRATTTSPVLSSSDTTVTSSKRLATGS